MRRRVKIEMTFDVEASVSRRELRAFLIDAVETWGGQRPAGRPSIRRCRAYRGAFPGRLADQAGEDIQ